MLNLGFRQFAIAAAIAVIVVWSFIFGWFQNDGNNQNASNMYTVSDWAPLKPRTFDLAADAKILASKMPFGPPAQGATAPMVNGAPGPQTPPSRDEE